MKDREVARLINLEDARQSEQIPLIASENVVSKDVLQAQASSFINKYAEGSVGKRYYAGNKHFDSIEELTQKRAINLFVPGKYKRDWSVNVQPLSGSPANLAICTALLKPGETILAMKLDAGGHLSHGHPLSLAGQLYNIEYYELDQKTELLDYDAIAKQALKVKPKLIIAGASAYSRLIDFNKFGEIAKSCGAYLLADISHIAGLVVAGYHNSPVPASDVIMTTTHKTLRGPRGAIILAKKELMPAINKAVFPGIQGGPHGNQIAAKAVCFYEADKPSFKKYIKQVIANARVMAHEFKKAKFKVVSGGTDNHLFLVDTTKAGYNGKLAQDALAELGIILNANAIPFDKFGPMQPSGIRIGTASITTLGADEKWSQALAKIIIQFLRNDLTRAEGRKQVKKLRATLQKGNWY